MILKNKPKLKREENVVDLEDMLTARQLAENYVAVIRAAYRVERRQQVTCTIKKLVTLESYPRTEKELWELLQYLSKEPENTRKELFVYLYKNKKNIQQTEKIIASDKCSKDERKRICKALVNLGITSRDILPFELIAFYGTKEFKQKDLELYLEKKDNLLEINYEIWKIVDTLKMDVSRYIDKQEIGKWKVYVNVFEESCQMEQAEVVLEVLERVENRSFKSEFLKMKCIEKKMKSEYVKEMSFEEVKSLGKLYSSLVMYTYSHLYKKEVFENEFLEILPVECRFTVKLVALLEKEMLQKEKVECIRELMNIYPQMAEYCKKLVLEMKEAEKITEEKEKQEYIKLGKMIKEKIRSFIEQGEYEAAKLTLNQLKVMLPKDVELIELEKQLAD